MLLRRVPKLHDVGGILARDDSLDMRAPGVKCVALFIGVSMAVLDRCHALGRACRVVQYPRQDVRRDVQCGHAGCR